MENKILIEIVQNHLKEDVLGVRQILNRGQVNKVYKISTKFSRYIIRIDPSENTIDRFQKETWCAEEALRVGVLTPRILHAGIAQEHPYMISSFIEGINGDESSDKVGIIWGKLGEYARKIHAIPVKGYGESMVSPGVFSGNWREFLSYNILSLNSEDKLLGLRVITSSQSQKLRDIFKNIKFTNFVFGLAHYDLSLNNTIITDDENVYLLDWGAAEVNAVPHIDIEEILESSLQDDSNEFELFLRGYDLAKIDYKKSSQKLRNLAC